MTDSQFKTTSVASVIAATFAPNVTRLINRSAPLLALLEKRPVGSNSINWTVEGTGVVPGIITEGSDFGNAASDALHKATATLYQFGTQFMISDTAMKVAAQGTNPAGVAEFSRQVENAVASVLGDATYGLGHYVFEGSGTSEIFGLDGICDLDGYTIFGIDTATVTQFGPQVVDGSAGALTFDMIDQGVEAMFTACGKTPDLWVVSPQTYRWIGKLALADKSLFATTTSVQTASGVIDPGYAMISVNGIPVVRDQHCPDAAIFGVDTSVTYVAYLPQVSNLGTGEEVYVIDASVGDNGVSGLPFSLIGLGRSGTAKKWGLVTDAALVVENPAHLVRVGNFIIPA